MKNNRYCLRRFALRSFSFRLAVCLFTGAPLLLPANPPLEVSASAIPRLFSREEVPHEPSVERSLHRRKQFKVKKNVDSQAAPEESAAVDKPAGEDSGNTRDGWPYWKILESTDFCDDGIPSEPYRNLWGIFIGVFRYKIDIPKLANSVHETEDLAAAFQTVCGLQEPSLLLDEEATLANVWLAFQSIARLAGPGDLLLFHFSGHGQGLANQGQEVGLLLLYDSPVLSQLMKGDFSTEVLDMMLNKRATYLFTAGSAKKTVSDGAVGRRGHGLLSCFILYALRHGDELSQYVPAYPNGGRKYYSTVYPRAAAAFRQQFPDDDSGPWPMFPGSLRRNLTEEKLPPSASPPAGSRSGWKVGTRLVGEKYRATEHARALLELLLFLEEGQPSFPTSSSPLRINASVYARPQFSLVEKLLGPSRIPWPEAWLPPGELLTAQELVRNHIRGANWRELPYDGATVFMQDEHSLRIQNLGEEPLVAYLIALDAAGILQWLSPSFPVNPTWIGYAFGEATLASGQAAYFPLAQEWNSRLFPIGSPVETAVDQRFMLICCPQRWEELEGLLQKASSLAQTIFHSQASRAAQALTVPMQSGGVRAVGRARFVPLDVCSRSQHSPFLPLTAVCQLEWRLLIVDPAMEHPCVGPRAEGLGRTMGRSGCYSLMRRQII